jgi:hypothetical protein
MRLYLLTTICIFINLLAICGQETIATHVKGTRFIINLPSEFKEDRTIPGFRSEIDSSIIFIVELDNPYSFEELLEIRISNILSMGLDTSNVKESFYDGYKSVQFNTFDSTQNRRGFNLNFGSDEFLINISITTFSNRLEELERIVMRGQYDKNLDVDFGSFLGFTVSYEGTAHKVFKKDANTINTREKNELEQVVAWLNLTRMPKSFYEESSAETAIDATYSFYYFDKLYQNTDSLIIDNHKLIWKLYVKDHRTYQEYNIIGIIQKKEFDLLIMGGVNRKEKLEELYGIIKSIKFTEN